MVLHILRALFVLLMAAAGYFAMKQISAATAPGATGSTLVDRYGVWAMMGTLAFGVLLVCIDILSPRKKLALISGTFLGILVGIVTAYALSFIVALLADQYLLGSPYQETVVTYANLVIGFICCYFAISFILQTKDDFRFIIPYVEFSKQTKGARPMLLDTSVLIDGRIADIAETGIFESQLIVPRFVLNELQAVADSGDKLKRNRGRRGLDVLARLQQNKRVEVILYDTSGRDQRDHDVDQKLMALAQELNGRVLTNDFNLNKVAQLRGVDVININDLANTLKPVVLPGEKMSVRLVKPGEESGQGVGYLEDGTMVVVEQGRGHINEDVEFIVTSALQTSAGRMIFGRMAEANGAATPTPTPARRGPRGRAEHHGPRDA